MPKCLAQSGGGNELGPLSLPKPQARTIAADRASTCDRAFVRQQDACMIWDRSIRQTLLPLGLVVVLSGCVYLYFAARSESEARRHFIDTAETIGELTAISIAPGLYVEDLATMSDHLRRISSLPGIDYLIISDHARVVVALYDDSLLVRGSPDRLLAEARETTAYRIETPIHLSGRQLGRLESGFSTDQLNAQIAERRRAIAMISVMIIVAACVLAMLLSRSLRRRAEKAGAQAEDELRIRTSQQLRGDRLRSLGEMAAGIAHELSQPLSVVMGKAEVSLIGMEEGWEVSPEETKAEMATIVEQAERMAHIIEHVRMFAREANEVKLEAVDVNEVVNLAVGMLGAQFRTHGIEIEYELTEELPSVLGNAFSLEEVLLNVLSNSRDAMKDTEPKQVTLRSSISPEEPDHIQMEIQDSGNGVDEKIVSKVFDPFFTTKEPDQGTGLGLSVSRSIIEGFGGRIGLRSQPGQGTIVTILLPTNPTSVTTESS
jgi:C4-dicarboxylate-specific signal transduction histidine kinase